MFGPTIFTALSDVSYLHRSFLFNIARYTTNSKKRNLSEEYSHCENSSVIDNSGGPDEMSDEG